VISAQALEAQKIANAFGTVPSRVKDFAPMVNEIIERLAIEELLDYGCGRGGLAALVKAPHAVTLQLYDPALEEYAGSPVPMQMVVCIDVLQHVEAEFRDAVLDDLARLCGAVLFVAIGTGELSPEEWFDRLASRFEVQTFQRTGERECYVLAHRRSWVNGD